MPINVAETIVKNHTDEDVLDLVIGYLRTASNNLTEDSIPSDLAGVALANLTVARSVLIEYRESKFGPKPVQVV